MVYATCTLHPAENEAVIESFLSANPTWEIEPPTPNSPASMFTTPQGLIKVLPHQHNMDGFFMVRLRKNKLFRVNTISDCKISPIGKFNSRRQIWLAIRVLKTW